MKKLPLLLLGFLAACTNEESPVAVSTSFISKGTIVVSNGGDGSISILDAETFQEKQRFFIAGNTQRFPHHIYFSNDFSKVSVALPTYDFSQGHENAHNNNQTGEILVLNANSGTTLSKISISAPNHDVIVDSESNEIWTQTVADPSKVLVYGFDNKLIKEITVNEDPAEILFAKNNTLAVIAGEESSFLTVIDKKTKAIVKEIKIDTYPTSLSLGRNDSEIIVGNTNKKSINIVNLNENKVSDFLDLDFKPGYAYFKGQSELWILAPEQGKVKIMEKKDNVWKLKSEINTEKDPHHFMFYKNFQKMVLVNQQSNSLQVFDANSYQLLKTIKTGSKPNGIAIWE